MEEAPRAEPKNDESAKDPAAAQARAWLRWFFWIGFVVGPIAASFGMLDVGAHMDGGPGIGLEGNGAPNALPYLFAVIAFACGTGGLCARAFSPEPRPPLIAGGLLGIVCFLGVFGISRPVFRWKWEFDCERNVAKACWAISELSTDPPTKEGLRAKACQLGDKRGCPKDETTEAAASSEPAAASAAPSASAP